jgi:energy-coupling factor transporter ATP-binding protein EcfA2
MVVNRPEAVAQFARERHDPVSLASSVIASYFRNRTPMPFNLAIPTRSDPVTINLEPGTTAVFVGANGSGKSRLAIYIEDAVGENAHRISAHRALTLNPGVPKINESGALKGLRFGNANPEINIGNRPGSRWNGNAGTALLNDFDFLIQALFAEQSRTALNTHKHRRAGSEHVAQPTKFERLQDIWEQLLPHRKLEISGDDVQVHVPESEQLYSAAQMSDGERAIFYLIGQTLVAADNSLLVIDEPELHVHRSIMNKLWDQLENARPDCALIFITHDLEFAASRVGLKFVVSDYAPTGPQWSIEVVPEDTGFSEELTTLLLGSRRPILFVEGDMHSLDKAIYRCVYSNWTIVPRGSCQDVVHAVATMRANAAFTRIRCAGIVDADDYDDADVARLKDMGVAVLPVSEIENLFLLPEISREIGVAEHLAAGEIETRLAGLAGDLLTLGRQPGVIDPIVRRYCLRRIDRALKKIDLSTHGSVEEIDAGYRQHTHGLDVQAIARVRVEKIDAAVSEGDLTALLSLIDNKGMLAKAASRLKNTSRDPFEAWLTRILLNDRAPGLVAALHRALPEIAQEQLATPLAVCAGDSDPVPASLVAHQPTD